MARTKSLSDLEILTAARRVILRRGYDRFTLSEVATEVGLSRAALILRFESTDALRYRLTAEMVDEFIARLKQLKLARGGDGLLALAHFVGVRTKDRAGVAAFFAATHANLRSPALAALEEKRGRAWHGKISALMPKTNIPHAAAVRSFATMITGAIAQWEARPGVIGAAHVDQCARDWLTLAGISYAKRKKSGASRPAKPGGARL